jgi:hypothetical protein
MANVRNLTRSFAGGEITPELFGRIDLQKRQEGLALCRNFITLPHGPAFNRPGTEFVREVKNSAAVTRIIPFSYNNLQTFCIELGAGYFRWHTGGATLSYADGAAYVASATATITIATPGVVAQNAHGKAAGDPVAFTTTGALPTGLTAGTTYYVLNPATNTYQLAATPGGAAIATSGTQSGTHTAHRPYSIGEIVKTGGINYYCRTASIGNAPPNTTYWYAMPTSPNLYEIPNSYAAADLFDIHFVQSADVLTLVHPNYPPTELRRFGATNWQTSTPVFTPPGNSIASVTWKTSANNTPPAPTATIEFWYVATTIAANTLEESVASTGQGFGFDLSTANSFLKATIVDANPSANARYYVYKKVVTDQTSSVASSLGPTNGFYGYIGQAQKDPDSGTYTFVDNNIVPDISRTPPVVDNTAAFASSGNYPGAVSYFQQRRVFAGTVNSPQTFWATRTGTESNMSYNIPVTSDNRINVRIASREASTIRHIVAAGQLLLLTATAEWRCSAVGDVLTPAAINMAPQSYVGASNVQPVVVNNLVLYAAARGGHIRELSYAWQASSFISGDICLMAPHLFDYNTLADMAYAKGPIPVLWCISSSGNLLGMTYVPEQEVAAWHRHDTAASGVFESCCVITEGSEDVLYVLVRRTINGSSKRYIERLHTRYFATLADAFYVDAGLTYSGSPATTISGLSHLEGQAVNVLADGVVRGGLTVSGGAITLPVAASKVTVGLPITAQLQTPPFSAQVDGAYGMGRQMNVNRVSLRVYNSAGFKAGPDFSAANLTVSPDFGSPAALMTGMSEVVIAPSWNWDGSVCVQQADPLPLDLVSLTAEVAIGG